MTDLHTKLPYGVGRQAVVRAAIDEVAANGLSRVTYRSIAARAGVTHGSVQHHFSSLESVLEEALEQSLVISLAPLREVETPSAFVQSILEVVEADPAIHAFQYELILEAKRRPAIRPYVQRLYESYWQALGVSLRGMNLDSSDEMVRAVFAAVDGMVFQLVTVASGDERGSRATTAGLERLLKSAPPAA